MPASTFENCTTNLGTLDSADIHGIETATRDSGRFERLR